MSSEQRLQPFIAAERLKEAYRSYITTSFPLRRKQLRAQFDRLVDEERLLWQDAFISLARRPKAGPTFAELIERGAITSGLTEVVDFGFAKLHDHQGRAIERLSSLGEARSTIIATGTGSGKTEAFLVPILDHCLRHPGPGVKAIVLYPMNALANDQLRRSRKLLAKTDAITFARFTGDTPWDEESSHKENQTPRPKESPKSELYYRKEIISGRPNLLLTNYTMLELLLTRKEERKALFENAPLQYLVIDEVHTFQGIRGTEVACLIRRLKEHVGVRTGRLTCIGTSATLQSEGPPSDLITFGSDLFGEPFDVDSVVAEKERDLPDPVPVPPPAGTITEELLAGDVTDPAHLRRLAGALLGRDFAGVGDVDLTGVLYDATRDHPLFIELERRFSRPRGVDELPAILRGFPGRGGLSDEQLRHEATAALLVGASAMARSPEGDDSEPRYSPKVHLVMRSLTPLARCLQPDCGTLLPDGRTECASDLHDRVPRAALPLGVCRTCGQDYWMATAPGVFRADEKKKDRRPRRLIGAQLSTVIDATSPKVYLVPSKDLADKAAVDDGGEPEPDDEDEIQLAEEGHVLLEAMLLCSNCRTLRVGEGACPGPGCDGKAPALPVKVFVGGTRCPVCLSVAKGSRPEIITPLRSGANSSITVLTSELFSELNEDERRTLIFADSRQDTAHQAGFLRERHQTFVRRQLMYRALQAEGKPVGLPSMATAVFHATSKTFGEAETVNLLIPADIRNVQDQGFVAKGVDPSGDQLRRTRSRLNWHCHLELTALAGQRNSLEREGLLDVQYSRLDDLAEKLAPGALQFGVASASRLAVVMRAMLDVVRFNKAVAYQPFREFLTENSESVARGEAQIIRYLRIPVAFGPASHRSSAFEIRAWHNTKGRRTAVEDVVSRLEPGLGVQQRRDLIALIVDELTKGGFLTGVSVGAKKKYGSQLADGLQLLPDRIDVSLANSAWRCDRCHRTRAWSLANSGGTQVCQTYECGGSPEPYSPTPDDSYYVTLYRDRDPKPLHAMEHSGQLTGSQRQLIERQFNEAAVNVLVCTPTLELGVNLPDLVALLMRNIPPTPANYAQRAGRAGRTRRIALVISHAGQGPHDSYFFDQPDAMISGQIRSPILLLDNQEIIHRHVHSLILENLSTEIPARWAEIADLDEGKLTTDVVARLGAELAEPSVRDRIAATVGRAFQNAALPWLDRDFVDHVISDFPQAVEKALEDWSYEYRELVDEYTKIKGKRKFNTEQEQRQMRQLERRMMTLSNDRDYYPLSYLARAGVLPRYGFPGNTIEVVDDQQQSIVQTASIGITEYAPGNRVYVGGRKLTVGRISFAGGAKEDPREHTETYRYCDRCTYMTEQPDATSCPYCRDETGGDRPLLLGQFIDYVRGQGIRPELIGDDDEYRDRSDYDTAVYLDEFVSAEDAQRHEHVFRAVGSWEVKYSRRREVQIFNRGLSEFSKTSHFGFMVCLECGAYHSPQQQKQDLEPKLFNTSTGHATFCKTPGWPKVDLDAKQQAEFFPNVEGHLHLRAKMTGDVVEIPLPGLISELYVAGDRSWLISLAYALKLGMQLDMHVDEREIAHFFSVRYSPGAADVSLVYYDTLPGGTGYLRRLFDRFPEVAARAYQHLKGHDCESACYRCLKQFWNQRDHALLDKRLVLPSLGMMASAATGREAPALSQSEQFDSVIESLVFTKLAEAGLPRPKVGRGNVLRDKTGRGILQMDLSWPDHNLVVLLDGREFHIASPSDVVADEDRRNAAIASGQRLLEFAGSEVLNQLDAVVGEISSALNAPALSSSVVGDLSLSPALANLRHVGFASAGHVVVEGLSIPCLAVRQQPTAVVVAVDEDHWVTDPKAWRSQLGRMRRLARAGIACYRATKARLLDPTPLLAALGAHALPTKASVKAVGEIVDLVPRSKADPFRSHLPVYSLGAAAGKFLDNQPVEEVGWVRTPDGLHLRRSMFVARVVGHSMEPRIPDGSYAVFDTDAAGSRDGKIMLVQLLGAEDPDTQSAYTVKLYRSVKAAGEEAEWQHDAIRLEPLNKEFEPIVLSNGDGLRVLAEYVRTL